MYADYRSARPRLIARILVALVVLLAALLPGISTRPAFAAQSDQGLQGGWAIDDAGNWDFVHGVRRQLPIMRDAGAGWARINFRLGGCFSNWTSLGCNGRTALNTYDAVVDAALANNLRVIGLISNESWHGGQDAWTANNTEVAGGNGDNGYVRAFAGGAAGVLSAHFAGRVGQWEVWNEPNAWTSLDRRGNPTGGTYLWPSNFAWLLARSYAAIKTARPDATVVSGGVLGHDLGGLSTVRYVDGMPRRVTLRGERAGARPTVRIANSELSTSSCREGVTSGAAYLCDTYLMGLSRAGWRSGAYPLDAVGQHVYVDQGGTTTVQKLLTYFQDVRNAYAQFEGAGTGKPIQVTEIGWTTSFVSPSVQAQNVATSYEAVRGASYVTRAYWFAVQDVPEADLYYGLVTGDGGAKPAFGAYRQAVSGPPPVACAPRPRVQVHTVPTGDGRLNVTVSASGANNGLREIRLGPGSNALVDGPGVGGSPGNATLALPAGSQSTQFFVRRGGPGPVTVPFVVLDRCGEWPTFVGGGAGAF